MTHASARRQAARAREVAALPPGAAGPVPSPCISVCRMDPATGWCAGCLRTLDEIAAWGTLPEDGKRAVWQAIAARACTLPPAAP